MIHRAVLPPVAGSPDPEPSAGGSGVAGGVGVVEVATLTAVTTAPEPSDVLVAADVVGLEAPVVVAGASVVVVLVVVLLVVVVELAVVELEVVVVAFGVVVVHVCVLDAPQAGTAPCPADACIGSRNAAPATASGVSIRLVDTTGQVGGAPLSARKIAHSVLTTPEMSGLSFARSPFDENTT